MSKNGAKTSTSATFECRNPITGEVVTRAPAFSPEDAAEAVAAARTAFAEWSRFGPNKRRTLLLAAAEVFAKRAGDLADSMMAETGASKGWALFNVGLATSMLREAASMTTQLTGEVIPTDHEGMLSMALRRPHGVVLGIAPWNAPVVLGTRALAMALACGNTVVLKASELCPGTHLLLGELLQEAGLPQGCVRVVTNAPADASKVVSALIAHPDIRHINFTGSSKVGRIIAEQAGRHLKPVLLELGGKSPLVVLDDADLDRAVSAAAFGAFMHQGQICMSTERIVVDNKVGDTFAKKFATKVSTLSAGDPRTSDAPLGSLISVQAAERVEELIDDAVGKGAKRLTGGRREGTVMDATVLDHVTPGMRIYGEESFGPVVAIVRAKDDDDAIRIANDTEYGLSASIFGTDISRAVRLAQQFDTGICHINGATVQDEAQIPFGGVKASGYGRFGGKAGIDQFTVLQWLTIETEPGHYPI